MSDRPLHLFALYTHLTRMGISNAPIWLLKLLVNLSTSHVTSIKQRNKCPHAWCNQFHSSKAPVYVSIRIAWPDSATYTQLCVANWLPGVASGNCAAWVAVADGSVFVQMPSAPRCVKQEERRLGDK